MCPKCKNGSKSCRETRNYTWVRWFGKLPV